MMKCVLVVEDDLLIRETLQELLEEEGYVVVTAENGLMALEYLQQLQLVAPNLILLDLMMPVKDGIEFCHDLVQSGSYQSVPVVVMTADRSVKEDSFFGRVQEFLKKPVDIETVVKVVAKWAV